jgi:hypothetical protein
MTLKFDFEGLTFMLPGTLIKIFSHLQYTSGNLFQMQWNWLSGDAVGFCNAETYILAIQGYRE